MPRRSEYLFVAIALAQLLLVGLGAVIFSHLDLSLLFSQELVSFEEVLSWTEI